MGGIVTSINKVKSKLFSNNAPYKHIVLVAFTVFIVKILGFVKESVISSKFGLTELLDSFYILILVPVFFKSTFIGAFQAVFIPNYINSKNKNNFKESLFSLTVLLGFIMVVLLFIILPYFNEYLTRSYSDKVVDIVNSNQYLFLFCIPIWTFSSILQGFLDINNKFIIRSLTPIFTSIVIISILLIFSSKIEYIFYAFILGAIIELVYVINISDVRISFGKINFKDKDVKILINQFSPKLISGLIVGLNPIVDQFFSSSIADGAISTLNYGSKFPVFATSLLSISVGNVLLPYFSRFKTNSNKEIKSELNKTLIFLLIVGSLITLILFNYGDFLISVFFEHGDFNKNNTREVFKVLRMFSFQIPFYVMNITLVRFLTAFNLNSFNIIMSLTAVIINFLANYFFIDKYGVSGIALSTSLVITVSFLIKYLYVNIKFS